MKYCLFAVVTQSFTSSSSSRDFIYGRPLRFLKIKLYLQSKFWEIILQQKNNFKMAEEKTKTDEVITLEVLERILKKVEKSEDVKIVKFFSGPSSERGENWTSNMIR